MPNSKARQAEIATRREQLIKLRLKKVRFNDPQILSLGYNSSQHASKDFYRALEERRTACEAQVTAYREEQNEILEALHRTYWPQAMEGDLKAGEMILKILERQSKLNGWEAVLKAEVSGPDGGAIPLGATVAELSHLIAAASDTDPEDPVPAAEEPGDDGD